MLQKDRELATFTKPPVILGRSPKEETVLARKVSGKLMNLAIEFSEKYNGEKMMTVKKAFGK